MYNTFIWDFDGTIFDSYPHITAAMYKMAHRCGIEGSPKEMRDSLEVDYKTAYADFNLTEEQIIEFRGYERDTELEPKIVPFRKSEMVLKAVCDAGKKNYIYTHRAKESTFFYLEKFGFMKYFEDFITADDGFLPKPNPNALNFLATKCGIDVKKALMIGDREIDVLAGVNAGMTGCLITNKTNISSAKYIVSDVGEIIKLV